jgi:outer membrane protein assembly factor BamB
LLCAAAAAATLAWWLADAPRMPGLRVPDARGSLAETAAGGGPRSTQGSTGVFTPGNGVAGTTGDRWLNFRGPLQENIARPGVPIAASWPAAGPPVRWTVLAGDGHAAPVVRDGRVYLLDYDETNRGDVVRCLSFADGGEIWRRFYPVHTKRNHGISRTVPALAGRYLVTFGPQCQVRCVDAQTGDHLWALDLVSRYGARVPLWYAGQCPFIDGDVAVIAVGGEKVLLAGIDCATGQTLWETPNPGGWQMSHASVAVATFHGVRQYIYAAIGGLAGVQAEGPGRGKLLWSTTQFSPSVVAPTPVPLPENRFLQTAGYGSGSALFEVRHSGADDWQVAEIERMSRRKFGCEQQTPVLRNGLLLTVLPSDAGDHRQELVGMTLAGEVLWHSGPQDRFGLGPFLGVGDELMLLMNDTGVLTLARATAGGYVRLARQAMFPEGRDAWGPMALVDGFLLLRDSTRLKCVDLR